jgi:uncharacterized RDD family membrane protein YckC
MDMLPENRAFLIRGDDGQEYGPVDLRELREWVQENRAGVGTAVCLDEPGAIWQPWQTYPELVALVAEVQGTRAGLAPSGVVVAPMGRRALACILDYILSSFLASPILAVMMSFMLPGWETILPQMLVQSPETFPPQVVLSVRLGQVLIFCVLALYMAGFHAAHGKTPAKAILKLRVVDKDGQKPSFYRSLLRGIVFACSLYLYGIPFLYAFFDSERRAAHDLIAGTYVVNE